MRKIFLSSLILLTTSFAWTAPFEGVIKMKTTTGNQKAFIDYFIKGNKMRMEMAAEKGIKSVVIHDFDKKKSYTLMEQNKTYMEMDLNQMMTKSDLKKSKGTLKKTGQSKKIAGYLCHEWIRTDNKYRTEFWMAQGFSPMPASTAFMDKNHAGYDEKMFKKGGFPLLVIGSKKGKEDFRMEAIKVQKKTLSQTLFKVPHGYQSFRMPGSGMDFMKNFPLKKN